EIVDYLNDQHIICKSLKEVMPKTLGSRKRVALYVGINLKGYYCSVLYIEKKSRLLGKEAGELIALHEKLDAYEDTQILTRYIRIRAPLCSHAKAMLEENGWKVWNE
ncbi:MAG TPA: hypothetical protein ENL02_04400, partial [Epsilonproteobacteria bacterium]|nr:hypothetical protein [Campylobacterota bacterium]